VRKVLREKFSDFRAPDIFAAHEDYSCNRAEFFRYCVMAKKKKAKAAKKKKK
jgi:hypothetical protein